MVAARSIVFSEENVRATLNNFKTTLRIPLEAKLITGKQCSPDDWQRDPGCKVGDRLWVKEEWAFVYDCGTREPYYKADGVEHEFESQQWVPAAKMPRWASRILLRIVSIRVERLFDINEEDAMKEGFRPTYHRELDYVSESAKSKFLSKFFRTHPEQKLDTNPWVWVIEFKVIKK